MYINKLYSSFIMCDQLAEAFNISPVELRQWTDHIDLQLPPALQPQPLGYPFDINLGNSDEIKGTKYTAYGVRLRGLLSSPTACRYQYRDEDYGSYPIPFPYACRIIIALDRQPLNTGAPFFYPFDENSILQLLDLSRTEKSWTVANRLLTGFTRFQVLADKQWVFNPPVVQYRQFSGGYFLFPEDGLLAFNHTDGSGDRTSRFVHNTDGTVVGAGLGGLFTVGTVEGPGVGVNALDANTNDPDRTVEVAGLVTGEPFTVAGGEATQEWNTSARYPEYTYPVTREVDFDIPFERPIDVPIAPGGFRPAITNRLVFWIIPNFLDLAGTLPPHAYKFNFQGFTQLFFTDY